MNDHAKRTGPAVEAHYQFLLWLVPTVDPGFCIRLDCCICSRPLMALCHE